MFRLTNPAKITSVRARFFVLGAALTFLAFKVWLAATTHGTNDVDTFFQFATDIVHTGPAEIYGVPHPGADLYNHPPLTGDMLWPQFFSIRSAALALAGCPVCPS